MATQPRTKAVIALGKRLAEQLGSDADLTAHWLSHLIAEKIIAAEQGTDASKVEAEQACTDLILELWRHRSAFPRSARPFENFDSIVRAVESLDPDQEQFRYAGSALRRGADQSLPPAAVEWLEFARGVDVIARQLIRLSLSQAVTASGMHESEWLSLAKAASEDDGPPEIIVRFILDENDEGATGDEVLKEERLQRLRAFINLAEALAAQLAVSPDEPPQGSP